MAKAAIDNRKGADSCCRSFGETKGKFGESLSVHKCDERKSPDVAPYSGTKSLAGGSDGPKGEDPLTSRGQYSHSSGVIYPTV